MPTSKCQKETKKKWKPKKGEIVFIPVIYVSDLFNEYKWLNDNFDRKSFSRNLVCRTKEEAQDKAKKMLKSIE